MRGPAGVRGLPLRRSRRAAWNSSRSRSSCSTSAREVMSRTSAYVNSTGPFAAAPAAFAVLLLPSAGRLRRARKRSKSSMIAADQSNPAPTRPTDQVSTSGGKKGGAPPRTGRGRRALERRRHGGRAAAAVRPRRRCARTSARHRRWCCCGGHIWPHRRQLLLLRGRRRRRCCCCCSCERRPRRCGRRPRCRRSRPASLGWRVSGVHHAGRIRAS